MADPLPPSLLLSEISAPNTTAFQPIETLKKIHQLQELLVQEQHKTFALHTPIGGVPYSLLTKILILGIALALILVIARKQDAIIALINSSA